MFGIGGICKVYGSLVSKRHRRHHEKNPSPNNAKLQAEDNLESTYQALNDKKHEERAIDDVHDHFRYNGEGMEGNGPASPRVFFKSHSVNNYFTTTPSLYSRSSSTTSLSRSVNRRSRTPTPVAAAGRLLRSMSRGNGDTSASPDGGSLSRSSSRRSRTPTPVTAAGRLLKSMSRRNGETSASPEGGSSRKGSTTAFPAGGGSLSRSTSCRKGSTPIMFSNSNGLIKPPAIEKNLECTLEELCFGCVKKIMITRDVVSNNGQTVEEEGEMLTIKVKPGWRKGTKITFEGMGNETPGIAPADIIFVIGEKRHPLFRREGDNLELAVEIPLVQALTGCSLSVPLLGGEKMSLTIDDIIQPGYEKIIAGQGMPKLNEQGNRGNLIIKFLVQFPTKLTGEQRADVFSVLQGSC